MSQQPSPNDHPLQPYAAAPPPLSPSEERTWATIGHVVPLAATVLSAGTTYQGQVSVLVSRMAAA